MTLAGLLARAALRRPDADAVVDGARRLTYGELERLSASLAGGFTRLGVHKGDRVLIALRNRAEHVLAYWALQRIGGVPTPVNFRLAAGEMAYLLDDSGARVVLFEGATGPAVLPAARGRDLILISADPDPPVEAVAFESLLAEGRGPDGEAGEEDLSLILYTSGTTGRPKGVPRTHQNHYAGALAHVIQCGYEWGERTLGVMPLYHTMGIHSLTSMVAVNGCFVCQPDWSAAGALGRIAAERLTALYLIPTLFYDLVHAPGLAPTDVSSVKKLAYAGAPMLAPLAEACLKAFGPRVFVDHYGSTEILRRLLREDGSAQPQGGGGAAGDARPRRA